MTRYPLLGPGWCLRSASGIGQDSATLMGKKPAPNGALVWKFWVEPVQALRRDALGLEVDPCE